MISFPAAALILHGLTSQDLRIKQGAESKETIDDLEKEDINLIHHQCIMMFWKPDGIHFFHRFLKKIFGGLSV